MITLNESRFYRALKPVFGTSPVVVTDSSALATILNQHEIRAVAYDQELAIPPDEDSVVLAVCDARNVPSFSVLQQAFAQTEVLVVPLLSFDGSLEASVYSLATIQECDFAGATAANRAWLERILNWEGTIGITRDGTHLTCAFDEEVALLAPKIEPRVERGELEAIGSFLETAVVSQPDDFSPSFEVNGTLTVPGVAVAHHRQMSPALTSTMDDIWSYFRGLRQAGAFPLTLLISHSRLEDVVDQHGRSHAQRVREFSNPRYDMMLTEFAFGTNASLSSGCIDWKFNSQMNEGAIGMHVAVGEGLTGAHIDFIAPDVRLSR